MFRRVEVTSGKLLPGNVQEILSGLKPGQRVAENALLLENCAWQSVGRTSLRLVGRASRRLAPREPMIRALVDYALNTRFLVLTGALLLLIWGAISFHNLPVEAYPDVANNYVQVITQWPGRAAEEVEQQVTIPIEIVMNGIPHLEHLRSTSLFGLSSVMLIFDDQSANDWNRQKVLERLGQLTLPNGLQPQMGSDFSPVGQIYWYTLRSTNPRYDLMELKSLQDWTLEKQYKSVPNVVDVASFGGVTREYQVRIDPDKLVSYGLTLGQVEQALANNNVNAGGSFVEAGLQQINVRALGLFRTIDDIGQTVVKAQNGTPLRVRIWRPWCKAPKSGSARSAKRSIERMAGSSTTATWWKVPCCCARAPRRRQRFKPSKRKRKS